MKKNLLPALFTIFSVFVISLLFFTRTPDSLLSRFSIFEDLYKNTSLTITSRKSVNIVSIDGKEYGETPLEIEDLVEGQHEVTLERKVEGDDLQFYEPVKIYLDLQTNTEAIVDVEIGPNGILSGYTLYYTPSPGNNPETGYLTVSSYPEHSSVSINEEKALEGPIEIMELTAKEYNVKISATGYESIEIPIIIREGFNLNLDVNLFPIPINLEIAVQ